jgi:hypothetical protein
VRPKRYLGLLKNSIHPTSIWHRFNTTLCSPQTYWPVKHELTKHIGVDAHFIQLQVQDGVVALQYVPSKIQLAYFFTKALTHAHH